MDNRGWFESEVLESVSLCNFSSPGAMQPWFRTRIGPSRRSLSAAVSSTRPAARAWSGVFLTDETRLSAQAWWGDGFAPLPGTWGSAEWQGDYHRFVFFVSCLQGEAQN